MRINILLLVAIIVGITSCSSPTSSLMDLDLMDKGVPLKLKAPENADVRVKDLGVFKDITIKKDTSFSLQITGGQVFNRVVKERKEEELTTIKELSTFSRVVQDEENGFVFEKKKGDKLTYDFRRIRIQGENEYLFQTGLVGRFSLEEVSLMFDASK